MSYWDTDKKVNKLVKDHEKSKVKNRVIPWWHRDEFVRRGPDKRQQDKLEEEYWKNWRKLDDDKD
jgi:hypothetical protein